MRLIHPAAILHNEEHRPVHLPVCDHYAGTEKRMRKALALQAERGSVFDITFDAEDGAAVGQEQAHAELMAQLISSEANMYGRVGVRVHDVHHPAFKTELDTLIRLAGQRIAYVMFPKINKAPEAQRCIEVLNETAAKYAVARWIPAHFLIETHGALADVFAIAALAQVESLSFGLMDFVSAHHGAISDAAMRSPGQFEQALVRRAKQEIAAACHAYGKVPSHNVTTEFRDPTQAHADAGRAHLEFAYTRMWSIHPEQIGAIVSALSPSREEVLTASEILLQAQHHGWGPISHAGHLHDRASFRYYWQVLQRAHAAHVSLPDEVVHAFFKENS
jgi:citrate lyase subunit beta/citryl-CoA lyase